MEMLSELRRPGPAPARAGLEAAEQRRVPTLREVVVGASEGGDG